MRLGIMTFTLSASTKSTKCRPETHKQRLKLRITSVKYMGQILSSEGMCPDTDKIKLLSRYHDQKKMLKNLQDL